jgi:diguanylate cyclase (GGDEF)-like protein
MGAVTTGLDRTGQFRRLTMAIAALTVALFVAAVLSAHDRPDLGVLLLFGGFSVLAENAAVVMPSSVRISPSSMFLLAAIAAFNGRATTVGALAVGVLCGLVVRHLRRHRWTVVAFNCSQYALSAAGAAACYLWLSRVHAPIVVVAAGASATFVLINAGLVIPASALESGDSRGRVWADVRPTLTTYFAFGFIGTLLGRLYVDVSPLAVIAIITPAVIARSAFAAVVQFRQAYGRLETLYGFTSELERSKDEDTTVTSVLRQACELLKADVAELTFGADRSWGQRTSLTRGEALAVTEDVGGEALEVEAAAAGPVLLTHEAADGPLGRLLFERKLRDAMVAPLRIEGEVVGTLLVAKQVPEAAAFTVEDLRLLETVTNHAAVSIQNNRLLDRLRWDSRHDGLTGLANRTRFNELIEAATAALPRPSAVLLIDLDRFKEINDTLGHHHGDLLLREVANRLCEHIGERGMVARLGGDEFGVLLPGSSSGDAAQVAVTLLSALEQPFTIGDLDLEVTASIGVALLPAHGHEPVKLLQRADVAMYAAKEAHSGWEIYARDRDHYSPRRLALAGQLRHAIDAGQMEVHYQPIAQLGSGRITGVEALLRWRHPVEGLLGPDDFVPIAEHAGLIRPLTLLVLRDAATQCRLLSLLSHDLEVAINLSVRTVLDVNLPDQVAAVMTELGVAPRFLTVEITESSVMADPSRTIGVLGRLSLLGVSIAIDDFGTGYSSLSYLKRMPVDEIKIDRSFVAGMMIDDNDAVIVRSTIELARSLGLRVVAEGVEDQATWNRLSEMGCDLAQGFYLSRPLPAAELPAMLQAVHPTRDPLR